MPDCRRRRLLRNGRRNMHGRDRIALCLQLRNKTERLKERRSLPGDASQSDCCFYQGAKVAPSKHLDRTRFTGRVITVTVTRCRGIRAPFTLCTHQIRRGVYGDETKAAPRSGMILEQLRAAHVCARRPIFQCVTLPLSNCPLPRPPRPSPSCLLARCRGTSQWRRETHSL